MERIRFNRGDVRFIAICLAIIAIGLWISLTRFHEAFPEASIDFRVDRKQAGEIALSFLERMDLTPPADYRHVSRFGYDDQAKTYLEKELGLKKAQRFFDDPIHLWFWQHRWFKPATKEEFSAYVTPSGRIMELRHLIEENAAGADLAEDSARGLVERFLYNEMNFSPESLVFLDASRTGRPNRSDWEFTYKARGIEPVDGSDYRYKVTVLGDRIGGYREYLHIPEEWKASYKKIRSYNDLASMFSSIGLLLTILAIIAVIGFRIRVRDIRWKTALWFGLVMFVLVLLNRLNGIPLNMYWYDTASSWSGFLTRTLFEAFLTALGGGVLIFVLTAGAETVYRERFPKHAALPKMFTLQGLRTKSAFKSILLGITLTPLFFAYQIAFYLVANRYGGWSPADVPYTNLLNTAMPWVAVLLIGFMPAVSEEFTSRMFSISFLDKLFKGKIRWLAVLIPALIWGFGHAGYPSQPWWIRGVEVGVAGILIGYVMLRFGILTTLVWHYTVDAFYTAMLLFRSENTYFVVTAAVGAGLLVVPLLAALAAYFRAGTFLPERGTLNEDFPPPTEREVAEMTADVEEPRNQGKAEPEKSGTMSLASSLKVVAVVLLLAGMATLFIPMDRIGDFIEFPVSAGQAEETFADSLRATGWVNPDTLRIAAFTRKGKGVQTALYLLKQLKSVPEFNRLYDSTLGAGYYNVQGWVPENRLRFSGQVHGKTGVLESLYPILPEEMPGDSLSKDSARVLLDEVLEKFGYDLSSMKLESYSETVRPHRVDHLFIYQALDGDPRHIGEAKFRKGGKVLGSWVTTSRRPYYKIPESWKRDREATTALRAVMQYGEYILQAIFAGVAIALLVLRARRGLVPWKRAAVLAFIPTVLALPNTVNIIYLAQKSYLDQVAIPWTVFRTMSVVSAFVSVLLFYILVFLGIALLGGLFPGERRYLTANQRRKGASDAVFAAMAGLGVLTLLRSITSYLAFQRPEWIPFNGWSVPSWIVLPSPLAAMVHSALAQGVMLLVVVGFFVYLWNGPFRKPLLRMLLFLVLVFMLISTNAREPGEWFLSGLFRVLTVLAVWEVLTFFIGNRPVSFVATVWTVATFDIAAPAIQTGNGAVSVQGIIFAVLSFMALAAWLRGKGARRGVG